MSHRQGRGLGDPRRALVLGGGGVAGIAWETGFLAGAAEQGLDLVSSADLLVGTSAGATVAAQVTSGVGLDTLLAAQMDASAAVEPALSVDLAQILGEINDLLSSSEDPEEGRRRVGRYSLRAKVPAETERRDIIRRRLPRHLWPATPLVVTAVDTATGRLVVLDRSSGIGLVDAVAASCAIPGVWPPVTHGPRRLMDGGMRSVSNADLALDHDRVIVLEPFVQAQQPADVARLATDQSVTIQPDSGYREVVVNALDPSVRPRAAELGRMQAWRMAPRLEQFWTTGLNNQAQGA